jgi:hypothetical protein
MSLFRRLAVVTMACAVGLSLATLPLEAGAARKKKDEEAPAAAENQPDLSKEFRKQAGPIQDAVNEQKWDEVLAGVAELETWPNLTRDEKRFTLVWKAQAQQSTGDKEGLMGTLEQMLEGGYATPEQVVSWNQTLAAHYSAQKDTEKTIYHYRQFIDAAPNPTPEELATMGSLYLQADKTQDGIEWLNKSIAASEAAGQVPDEVLFQRLDGAYVALDDRAGRLNNLEALIKRYPKSDYYSRLLAIYSNSTKDDRILMLNAYRLALTDVGLATVGEHLGYADTALSLGSPGEALKAMEKGMSAGIVPSAGSNQEIVQEAKTAVARDRRDLPKDDQAAAKDPQGEFDVKVGLGFYSLGEWEKSVEAVKRGLGKGGVKRVDDANMLLGAALVELGRYDEAKQAFAASAGAAGSNDFMRRLAGLWSAYADRKSGGTGAG